MTERCAVHHRQYPGHPSDRVINGIDQTAMLLNGDTNGRRDYVHIYTGPLLAATVKQQFKRHWVGDRPV